MWWMLMGCRALILPELQTKQEVLESAEFAPPDLLNREVTFDKSFCPAPAQLGKAEVVVQVLDPEGQPVPDIVIGHKIHPESAQTADGVTDALGQLRLQVPWGWEISAPLIYESRVICTLSNRVETIRLQPKQMEGLQMLHRSPIDQKSEIHGVVRLSDGTPVANAIIRVVALPDISLADFLLKGPISTKNISDLMSKFKNVVKSDENGHYSVEVVPVHTHLMISTEWNESHSSQAIIVKKGQSVGQDLYLEGGHHVEVRCVGYPNDSCEDVVSPTCYSASSLKELENRPMRNSVLCPSIEAVVSAGTTAVRIGANDSVAWLDFRKYQGRLQGELQGGTGRCWLLLTHSLPRVVLDAPLESFSISMDDTYHFASGPLPPSTYNVTAHCDGNAQDLGQLTIGDQPLVTNLYWNNQ